VRVSWFSGLNRGDGVKDFGERAVFSVVSHGMGEVVFVKVTIGSTGAAGAETG